MTNRTAAIERVTGETKIELSLAVDGSGESRVDTGVGFFDHMLTLLAKHALFDLDVKAVGDIHVDAHHTVEDVGICLGQALTRALGDKRGISRYGFFLLPMDETLAQVALDISGRPLLVWRANVPAGMCGGFDSYLGQEFMQALCTNGGINMHVDMSSSPNPHHALEAIFKGVARALRMAVSFDSREKGVPSSKGVL